MTNKLVPEEIQTPLGVEHFNIHSHLKRVLDGLQLTEESLIDKKIFEIGSGQAYLAEEARKKGIDIVSFDFVYGTPNGRKIFQEYSHSKKEYVLIEDPNAIGGVAENLPFANESFDFVLAYSSVPKYSSTKEQAEAAIDEMVRITKPNGEARIFPFLIEPNLYSGIKQDKGYISERSAYARFDETTNDTDIDDLLNKDEKTIIQKLKRNPNLIVLLERSKSVPLLIIKKNG